MARTSPQGLHLFCHVAKDPALGYPSVWLEVLAGKGGGQATANKGHAMRTTTVMSDRKVCMTCKKWSGKRRSLPRRGAKGFRVEADESAEGFCSQLRSRTEPLYGCAHHVPAKF